MEGARRGSAAAGGVLRVSKGEKKQHVIIIVLAVIMVSWGPSRQIVGGEPAFDLFVEGDKAACAANHLWLQ